MENPSHRKRSLPLSPVKSDLSSNLIPSLPLSSSKNISSEASQKKDNTMNWICMECKEADAMEDPESELLLCEGPCHRVFHQICVGLSNIPSEAWYCTDCRNETHACAICHVYGTDNVDLFLCSHKFCGLWYHESCLSMCHVEFHHPIIEQSLLQRQQSSKFDIDNCMPESNETFANDYDLLPKREFHITSPEFKCPAHRCWTCSEDMIVIDDDKEDTQKEGSRSKKRKSKTIKDTDFGVKTGNLFVRANQSHFTSLIKIILHVKCVFSISHAILLPPSFSHIPYRDVLNALLRTTYHVYHPLQSSMSWPYFVTSTLQLSSCPIWIYRHHFKGNSNLQQIKKLNP
jgi:PHD-finger